MTLAHLNDANFIEETKTGLALIDFWAPWCGPCRMFGPVFESAANAHADIKFCKFEIDDANRIVPAKFGIRSIPSVLAFKDGNLIEAKSGLMSPGDLDDWIAKLKK